MDIIPVFKGGKVSVWEHGGRTMDPAYSCAQIVCADSGRKLRPVAIRKLVEDCSNLRDLICKHHVLLPVEPGILVFQMVPPTVDGRKFDLSIFQITAVYPDRPQLEFEPLLAEDGSLFETLEDLPSELIPPFHALEEKFYCMGCHHPHYCTHGKPTS